MRFYEITLRPLTAFGTPLAGDTLFGQFCWQVAYDPGLLNGGLEANLARYADRPFAVFSSALFRIEENGRSAYALRRPALPSAWLAPPSDKADRLSRLRHLKRVKEKAWLLLDQDLRVNFTRLMDDTELLTLLLAKVPQALQRLCQRAGARRPLEHFPQPHNTINRQTLTTGEDRFAPYTQPVHFYLPGTELVILVLFDEGATDLERLSLGLKRIGRSGFGKDASIGLGRFEVVGTRELTLPRADKADAFLTLAPCVPAPGSYKKAFFIPLVRYGRHGDRLATSPHPFKAPVVMASEGAVFVPSDSEALGPPYFGQAVTRVSKAEPKTVAQGYAPVLPFRLEVPHE